MDDKLTQIDDKITQIKILLRSLGMEIEQERKPLKITSIADIDDLHVPTQPGIYWIETTMPVDLLRTAISEVLKKQNSEALENQKRMLEVLVEQGEQNSEALEKQKGIVEALEKQKRTLEKQKRIRLEPPQGAKLILQTDNRPYVVYSGTEDNINERLKQHLFNEGGQGTARLSCVIDEHPFSDYEWQVSFQVIDSYEIRYAVEAWWRLNVGWPLFCIR